MYAGYHIESKEYDKALKEYEELLTITKKTALFRHVQLLQERAKVLVLMNQKQEACKIYEEINHLKDSLDAQSYLSQINELHTLYQIDKSELNYINIQKNLYYWSLHQQSSSAITTGTGKSQETSRKVYPHQKPFSLQYEP